jgi:hypothetical protein
MPQPPIIPARSLPRLPELGSAMLAAEVWSMLVSTSLPAVRLCGSPYQEVRGMPGSTRLHWRMSSARRLSPSHLLARVPASSFRSNFGDSPMQPCQTLFCFHLHLRLSARTDWVRLAADVLALSVRPNPQEALPPARKSLCSSNT